MIEESYVSSETAKLLKEKGFREWCRKSYGMDVRYKGRTIDFDEECELKDEGRENEIEYVDGGLLYNFGSSNENHDDEKVYAAPTLGLAIDWLRKKHNLAISVSVTVDGWHSSVSQIKLDSEGFVVDIIDGIDNGNIPNHDTYEKAAEATIKYCLENLI